MAKKSLLYTSCASRCQDTELCCTDVVLRGPVCTYSALKRPCSEVISRMYFITTYPSSRRLRILQNIHKTLKLPKMLV